MISKTWWNSKILTTKVDQNIDFRFLDNFTKAKHYVTKCQWMDKD